MTWSDCRRAAGAHLEDALRRQRARQQPIRSNLQQQLPDASNAHTRRKERSGVYATTLCQFA
jgi:hypothetical protein